LRVNVNVQDKEHINLSSLKIIILIISGLAGLIAGGRLIVVNAVQIAQAIGVSEKVIALTIVAAGTSLPELATSVVAALKKNNDIAVGNIIGSNIFNIFLILGASSVIKPVGYDKIFNIDLYFLSVGTIVLFIAMFTGNRKKLDRWEAVVFLLLYCGYLFYMLAH
jgi:cation:H+ antiporter